MLPASAAGSLLSSPRARAALSCATLSRSTSGRLRRASCSCSRRGSWLPAVRALPPGCGRALCTCTGASLGRLRLGLRCLLISMIRIQLAWCYGLRATRRDKKLNRSKKLTDLRAPPGLRGQTILNLLFLTGKQILPFTHLALEKLGDDLLAAHRREQLALNARQILLGQRQLAPLQLDHLVQGRLVALLVVTLQRRGHGHGETAQTAEAGDVVAVALAKVLLVADAAEHLLHLVAAQAGQAAEDFYLFFHLMMLCRVATLAPSSALAPTSWRRKRSRLGASCTARSVLASMPGV